ncbi:MAG: GNAT family N-acetyltransferase [Rhodoblastus sp.]|nr:GNAT family N-acetyltransferase [Rhodoblastus sp.]
MARFATLRETSARHAAQQIRVAANPADIADEWRLLEETGHATVFQTRAWLEPWFEIVAHNARADPVLVLVSDRASGAPQMLLPLCRRRERALASIEFADLGASDYNAPLIATDFRPSQTEFSSLWAVIRSVLPAADILRIDKSPATIGNAPNPLASLSFMRRLSLGAWNVTLPASHDAYVREILSARHRKELARKHRRLEASGALRFVRASGPNEAVIMLRALADMRRKRYIALGRRDILADDAFCAFYENLLARADMLAETWALDVGGVRVAILFGLRHAGAFHFLLSGFSDGEWASKSVGSVAADFMIAQAIEDSLQVFDFTIGNAPYKRHFGAVRRDLFGGAQALSYRALPQVAERRIKGSLRALLLPPAAARPMPGQWR